MKKICGNCFSRISGNVCRKCGHVNVRTSAEYDALPVGTQLRGRYTVGKLMGRGGFGMIYLAYDEQSDKTVAVKEFFSDGTAVRSQDNITAEPMTTIQQENYGEGLDRFFREAEIISGFPECSELIGIYDVFRENGTAYYAMEFVHGASLKSYAETSSAISSAQAVYIAQKLLPSLQILHQRGVIHRDVSPDNIMLCADGSVKLIDFGSARYIQDRTCSMSVILKQGFAPLEQYQRRGAQGGWTDIYSFGASLFYAMTLVTPEDPLTRLEDDSDFEFQLHGITPSLAEILRRSCNVRRELRYQNAEEMLGAVSVCGVEPVGFPADKIQQAVRSSAAPEGSLARGGTFLSTAAAALTSAASSAAEFFSGISRTITPIKVRIGGEMFPVNSVELDLSDRELTNAQIINLRHMKRLKVLNLNYNYITDLACLEGLTQLEELHFSHNNVTDLSFLSGMTELRRISAENTGLADISPLAGKLRLEAVFIGDSLVTDITPLKSALGLRFLGCNELQIGSLDALEGMTELETVCLAGCGLWSIQPLSSGKKLRNVYLGRNNVSDLSPLIGCDIAEMYLDLNKLNGNREAFRGLTVHGFIVMNGNGYAQEDLEYIRSTINGEANLEI